MNNIEVLSCGTKSIQTKKVLEVIEMIAFTALMAISSKVKIQTALVPFTLQIFIMMSSSFYIGNRKAIIPQITYMIMGLGGAFIFANGGGIQYVLSPTFGYIIGFIACSYIMGYLLEKTGLNISNFKLITISIIGLFACYFIGIIYLYIISAIVLGKTIQMYDIIISGAAIFLPFDLIKILIALGITRILNRRSKSDE